MLSPISSTGVLFQTAARLLPREEVLNHRRLARLFQEKAIVTVRCLDHVELYVLSEGAKRGGELLGTGRRIEPVRAEGDEQRSRAHVPQSVRQGAVAVLAREIEIRQRARRIEIR